MPQKILAASLVILHFLTQSAGAFEFQPMFRQVPVQSIPPVSLPISSDISVNQPLVKDQGLSVLKNASADQTLADLGALYVSPSQTFSQALASGISQINWSQPFEAVAGLQLIDGFWLFDRGTYGIGNFLNGR